MQVTETAAEGLRREFKIVVDAADIEQRVTERLDDLGGKIRLPGFRPGKIPRKILRQRYGKSVLGEVLETRIGEEARSDGADRAGEMRRVGKVQIVTFQYRTAGVLDADGVAGDDGVGYPYCTIRQVYVCASVESAIGEGNVGDLHWFTGAEIECSAVSAGTVACKEDVDQMHWPIQ